VVVCEGVSTEPQYIDALKEGGSEAIGGHVHVTSVRLAFAAHPINRLKGVMSLPLPEIVRVEPWKSGPSVGFAVSTGRCTVRFVSWSRRRALDALDGARRSFGDQEQAILALVPNADPSSRSVDPPTC